MIVVVLIVGAVAWYVGRHYPRGGFRRARLTVLNGGAERAARIARDPQIAWTASGPVPGGAQPDIQQPVGAAGPDSASVGRGGGCDL